LAPFIFFLSFRLYFFRERSKRGNSNSFFFFLPSPPPLLLSRILRNWSLFLSSSVSCLPFFPFHRRKEGGCRERICDSSFFCDFVGPLGRSLSFPSLPPFFPRRFFSIFPLPLYDSDMMAKKKAHAPAFSSEVSIPYSFSSPTPPEG